MESWLTQQCKIITCNLRQVKQNDVVNGSAYMHVFIHPASLWSLVGAFNLFTFKVLINMYDPITIVLVVLFSVSLFLLLCSLPREVPLAFLL